MRGVYPSFCRGARSLWLRLERYPKHSDAASLLGSLALCYAKKDEAKRALNLIRRACSIIRKNVVLLYYEAMIKYEQLPCKAPVGVLLLHPVRRASCP